MGATEPIYLMLSDIVDMDDESGLAVLRVRVEIASLKRLIAGARLEDAGYAPHWLLKVVPDDE